LKKNIKPNKGINQPMKVGLKWAKMRLAEFLTVKLREPQVLLSLALFWPVSKRALFKIK